MQREIKFRGKRVDTGKWVYGYLVKDSIGMTYIITYFGCSITACSDCGVPAVDYYEVIPETVGQYTGLKDKNGKEIYNLDIISHYREYALVIWNEDRYILKWLSESCNYHEELCFWATERKISVIGNIFDNRELIDNPELCLDILN